MSPISLAGDRGLSKTRDDRSNTPFTGRQHKSPRVMYKSINGDAQLEKEGNTARRKRAQAGFQNAPKVHYYPIAPVKYSP